MSRDDYVKKIGTLMTHAWEEPIKWPHIEAWASNFKGEILSKDEEQLYMLFALSRFMYFGQKITREMLVSLYRDYFKSPLIQRMRRNCGNTKDAALLNRLYASELRATRFVGVGNPAESGAHLLYFFRQVNYLKKDLFVDFASAFSPLTQSRNTSSGMYLSRIPGVNRYVFFDDLVGSGSQAKRYLSRHLKKIRRDNRDIELKFMCLFATSEGIKRMNEPDMFDGNAICLFELDDSYKAFSEKPRHLDGHPDWFNLDRLKQIALNYGQKLQPKYPLGYQDGQLLLGFSHNTPDNTLPVFWDEGGLHPWSPAFLRYNKVYL